MNTSTIMNSFYEDEIFKNEFAIAFSLSIPFLIYENDESCELASLIYQSDITNEDNIECIGYIKYNNGIKYNLTPVPFINDASTFSLIKKKDIQIESKNDYEIIISRINSLLDEIKPFAFKSPCELSELQKKCVADYTQLLCTLTTKKLLECYYAIEPLFCDWCCNITLNV